MAKKILFSQLNWSIVQFSVDLVDLLIKEGYEVTVIVTESSISPYADIYSTQAEVIVLNRGCKSWYRYFRYFWKFFSRLAILADPIDPFLKYSFSSYIKKRKFDSVILVENESLIAFERSPYKSNISKTFYHSLELYVEDHDLFPKHKRMILEGRKVLKSMDNIIIQDDDRYLELCKRSVGISANFIPYPVGCRPLSVPNSRHIARDFLKSIGIKSSKKIILSVGNISKARCLDEIVKLARNLPDDYVVLLHGHVLGRISLANLPENIYLSRSVLTDIELFSIISLSTIGLSFYRTDNVNESLTAFSSHRIALYLRSGLPIISFKTSSYEKLFERYKCGICIQEIHDSISAILEINSQFSKYSEQAILAYEGIYNSENSVLNITNALQE